MSPKRRTNRPLSQNKDRVALLRTESLEPRLCLTAMLAFESGQLLVAGQPDGPLDIGVNEANQLEITDNGELLASLSGVNTLRVEIDESTGVSDDVVSIQLTGAEFETVIVKLGGGDNSLSFEGGAAGYFEYWGGDGNDNVVLQSQTSVDEGLIELGSGHDTAQLHGEVRGDIEIHGDAGDDSVLVGTTANVNGTLTIVLGSGENALTVLGDVGSLLVSSENEGEP